MADGFPSIRREKAAVCSLVPFGALLRGGSVDLDLRSDCLLGNVHNSLPCSGLLNIAISILVKRNTICLSWEEYGKSACMLFVFVYFLLFFFVSVRLDFNSALRVPSFPGAIDCPGEVRPCPCGTENSRCNKAEQNIMGNFIACATLDTQYRDSCMAKSQETAQSL